jgi:hypothetical protein
MVDALTTHLSKRRRRREEEEEEERRRRKTKKKFSRWYPHSCDGNMVMP